MMSLLHHIPILIWHFIIFFLLPIADGSRRRQRRSVLPALMDFLASKMNALTPSKSSKSI